MEDIKRTSEGHTKKKVTALLASNELVPNKAINLKLLRYARLATAWAIARRL